MTDYKIQDTGANPYIIGKLCGITSQGAGRVQRTNGEEQQSWGAAAARVPEGQLIPNLGTTGSSWVNGIGESKHTFNLYERDYYK